MIETLKVINTIDAHVAGEPIRVIVSGLPFIPGGTMAEKKKYFEENLDDVRRMLVNEPRGHSDMYCSAITPPVTPDGDFGLLFIHSAGLSAMCGHATIGTVAVAVQSGMLHTHEGKNIIKIDVPAGRVTASVEIKNGRPVSVSFDNVPAFVYKKDVEVPFEGHSINVDIVFCGDFFVFVDEEKLGCAVSLENREEMTRKALAVMRWCDNNVEIVHPEQTSIVGLYGVVATSKTSKTDDGYKDIQTAIIGSGAIDRSPCGTGVSGKLALEFALGNYTEHDKLHAFSILGTEFIGTIAGVTKSAGFDAIIPNVSGTAYITGYHQFVLDPNDPLPCGFRL